MVMAAVNAEAPNHDQSAPLVSFAATFSFDPIQRWINFWLLELGLPARLAFADYGQLQHELQNPQCFSRASACVGLLNLADWQRGNSSTSFDSTRFQADLDLFLESLHRALVTCPRLILILCPARPSPLAGPHRSAAFNVAAGRLQELAMQNPRFSVLTSSQLAAWYPVPEPFDVVADEIGHLPYTDAMWCALGAACARMLLPALAPPLKALVVDCDYTLWHNAVGEVGAAGIVCAPRHRDLQERLLALRQAGALICLCSRNLEADVWDALESEEMLLRREHVTAARIDPHLRKSEAIKQIAKELQISYESILFIDDNPAECHEVRSVLPQVAAWCMPQLHAEVKQQMPHVWKLDIHAAASREDSQRAELYKAQSERQKLLAATGSLTQFHNELQVKINFETLSESSPDLLERVLQMQQRTNQFNAWKRYPVPPAVLTKCEGIVMSVRDRYGDYGVVGAALCQRSRDHLKVISLTMSCRVLGRGAEHALLAELAKVALHSPSCSFVKIGVVEAERNKPILRFLKWVVSKVAGSSLQMPRTCDGVGAAQYHQSQSVESWDDTSPQYWYCFPSIVLGALKFDPEEQVTHDAEGDEHTSLNSVVENEQMHKQQSNWLCTLASALTDIPTNLRSMQQVLQKQGCEVLLPPTSQEGCTSEEHTRNTLRLVWQNILQLPVPADDQLDMNDDVPFAACGGDSVLSVQFISLAERYGLRLPRSSNIEMMTINQLLQLCCSKNDTRSHGKAISQNSADVKQGPEDSAHKQDALNILERDLRTPKADLRISGISSCAVGNLDEAKRVMEQGVWYPAYAVDRHKNTALMWAAGCGHLHIVRWLLEEVGVSVDTTNKDGRSALMWACKNGKLQIVRYLLEQGGANVMLRMKDDSTAFDWAVLGGDISTMEFVASHPDVDLHALNKFGCSAVQWAAASGNVVTCKWLYSKGILFGHMNQARHGAVNKAAWKGHAAALRWMLLEEDGPKLTDQLFSLDHEGLSVAQLARMGGHEEIADWLQTLIDELRSSAPPEPVAEALARDKARCRA